MLVSYRTVFAAAAAARDSGRQSPRCTAAVTAAAVMGARPWLSSLLLAAVLGAAVTTQDDSHRHLIRDPRQVELVDSLDAYSVIFPRRVDAEGRFLSHTLEHILPPATSRKTREIHENTLHYHIEVEGDPVHLLLRPNDALFAPGLVLERRRHRSGNVSDSTLHRIHGNTCHFTGHVVNDEASRVSLATCKGLTGALHLSKGQFLIEPVRGHDHDPHKRHPHIIYRRPRDDKHDVSNDDVTETCGVQDDGKNDKERQQWEDEHNPRSRDRILRHDRRKRSTSLERHVETLVVVDHTMIEFYREDDIENYVLTIMNMVSMIFHDATLGNAVNIALVRLIFLEKTEPILDINHHADITLKSFCKWQQSINPPDDSHPNHHDVALLITRLDICAHMNEPCSTLGLAHVNGMCQPHRSCNINEDTGLGLAYTVAHELGHNVGMQHDGEGNDCSTFSADGQHVMSAQISGDATSLIWSSCSRNYITRFLDRDWGYCLNDPPGKHNFSFPSLPPGVMYDANHQCRLQHGVGAQFCEGIDEMCATLWCQVNNKCVTRMDVTAHGTNCGTNKWCYVGQCVPIGDAPSAIQGEWGAWTDWGRCSRTCGGGVSVSQRHCSNPPPSHGGQYCLGERKRYRICHTDECANGGPSFRAQQCAGFNDIPYENRLYHWVPESTPETPCQLHCRPQNEFFSVLLQDSVEDGTPCRLGLKDMCINGGCRHVGCDWLLDSSAVEDHCGVCKGDGSTCKTIKNQFNKTIGKGYEEAVVIPQGARNIRIEEVAEANNYLAVRDSEGESLLNGDWYIQWSGDYEAAGTIIHYERDGNKERVESPGPLKEPLHIMLLFQSQNPGVVFEYTVPTEGTGGIRQPEFGWEVEGWTHCSASCGGGQQLSRVVCKEREAGMVDDRYCDASTKADDQRRTCNKHACPARWWFGPWQHCSVTCGPYGRRKRTVLCVRSLGPDEQLALDDADCSELHRPDNSKPCAHQTPCPETDEWIIGPWDQECRDDPCEVQQRQVTCSGTTCDPESRPQERSQCGNVTCGTWMSGNWTQCTRSCGTGIQLRSVRCHHGDACLERARPEFQQDCARDPCPRATSDTRSENQLKSAGGDIYSEYKSKSSQQTGLTSTNNQERALPTTNSTSSDNVTGPEVTTKATVDLEVTTEVTTEVATEKYRWIPLFWEQCTDECGGGERHRKVMCIEVLSLKEVPEIQCASMQRPESAQKCNVGPCVSWLAGSWSECSVTCGNGEQARHVQCVDPTTSQPAVDCSDKAQPISTRSCQLTPCTANAAFQQHEEYQCEADVINPSLCKSLKKLGQCQNRYIQLKCCRTCHEKRRYDTLDTTS